MTQTLTKFEQFDAAYDAFDKGFAAGQAEWVKQLRQTALNRFNDIGFPTARRGNEPWKYTNVAPIARTEFSFLPEVSCLPEASRDDVAGPFGR